MLDHLSLCCQTICAANFTSPVQTGLNSCLSACQSIDGACCFLPSGLTFGRKHFFFIFIFIFIFFYDGEMTVRRRLLPINAVPTSAASKKKKSSNGLAPAGDSTLEEKQREEQHVWVTNTPWQTDLTNPCFTYFILIIQRAKLERNRTRQPDYRHHSAICVWFKEDNKGTAKNTVEVRKQADVFIFVKCPKCDKNLFIFVLILSDWKMV